MVWSGGLRGPAAAGTTTAGLAGRDYLRYPANVPATAPTARIRYGGIGSSDACDTRRRPSRHDEGS